MSFYDVFNRNGGRIGLDLTDDRILLLAERQDESDQRVVVGLAAEEAREVARELVAAADRLERSNR